MSDLISRQALLDKLKDFSDMYTLKDEAKVVLETIVRIVSEQPTAYDAEKVVAELESAENYYYDDKLDAECNLIMFKSIEQKVAIDIVRKGGVE